MGSKEKWENIQTVIMLPTYSSKTRTAIHAVNSPVKIAEDFQYHSNLNVEKIFILAQFGHY
jgi:hypothetical protein